MTHDYAPYGLAIMVALITGTTMWYIGLEYVAMWKRYQAKRRATQAAYAKSLRAQMRPRRRSSRSPTVRGRGIQAKWRASKQKLNAYLTVNALLTI